MVGILLDNAQEYVTTIEEKHIDILITSHTKVTELVISNPYIPDHYTLRNFKQEGFSLKGNDRGMGLSTITKIEKKHDNLTVLFEKNTIFSAKIITTKL
ncbi:GHKL domain-containing protein [Dolosigranulum pigrum]|uniref:GHKL domain-containing protein n=1 Tax=Dolosigranulum pigrum TaxID=29394 RepID=UPI001AD8766E|nr:GHKL domain-containing protein [Dolosigranulum pigrum]